MCLLLPLSPMPAAVPFADLTTTYVCCSPRAIPPSTCCSLLLLPPPCSLLFVSQADAAQIASLAASLRRRGRNVLEQVWHDSPHVGHLR